MCMKKPKPKQFKFEIVYDPYNLKEDDTFDSMLKRYIDDENVQFVRNELVYYRAFQIIRTTFRGNRLIVALSNQIELKLGDIIIDDHDNTYEVKGFEMIRLVSGTFPDWYRIISFVLLRGNAENIGEYFAKQNIIKE